MRVILALMLLFPVVLCGCGPAKPRVVLYCAQDQEFAEEVLAQFESRSGIHVDVKFDTEADKSVSLFLELVKEKDRPRCDVFWNNEILSTLRLQQQKMLDPYASSSAEPYSASARDTDHFWHAFAGRARILIVNAKLLAKDSQPQSILDLTDPRYRDRVVMARPQFGTSATQAACLFEVLGTEKAEDYYRALKSNGVQIAPGNKQVAEWVGKGVTPRGQTVAVGITDTDDAMDEIRAGHPVTIIYPDRKAPATSRLGTLFIPNTLSIIRGGPNAEGARKLVDYLLSPEVEKKLAESESCQFPLNPQVNAKLPPEIETPGTVKEMQVDFAKAAELWGTVQTFLAKEFER
jgi:iron(III) transport system substrate-binding protein